MNKYSFILPLMMLPLVFIASTAHLSAQYFAFSLRPGYSWDRMKPTGSEVKHLQFPTSAQPTLSLAIDVDGFGDIFFRFELAYRKISFHAKAMNDSSETYDFVQAMANPEISLLYRVPSKWKLQGYCGAGFGFTGGDDSKNNWHHVSNSDHPENFIRLDSWPFSLLLHAGIMYNKRIDLHSKFTWVKWAGHDDSPQRIMGKSIALVLSYRFGKIP